MSYIMSGTWITVKLEDAHLGLLQFAHKEKDEIEAMLHLIIS